MKKLICLLVCLWVLLTATACANAPSSPTQPANHFVPRIVTISSYEELHSFVAATSLTDAHQRSGFQDKNELLEFSQLMQAVGYPIASGMQETDTFKMQYRPEEGLYDIIYRLDGTRYRFVYTKFDSFTSRAGAVPIVSYTIEDALLALYQGVGCLVGEIYANGYQIRIIAEDYTDCNALAFKEFHWSTDMVYMQAGGH